MHAPARVIVRVRHQVDINLALDGASVGVVDEVLGWGVWRHWIAQPATPCDNHAHRLRGAPILRCYLVWARTPERDLSSTHGSSYSCSHRSVRSDPGVGTKPERPKEAAQGAK
jgi:hypothetical protein